MTTLTDNILETDVLVIGGGLAGCFAAVRAREKGADVILVEKNYVGKTGSSHYARDFMVFNENWGDNLEEWKEQFARIGEWVADQSWDETILKESYARYLDLISWGETFYKKDGTPSFPAPWEEPWRSVIRKTKYRYTTLIAKFGMRHKMMCARRKVESIGAKILDRVMLVDLVKRDDRVAGAYGFHTRTGEFYLIKAKSTIIATGGLGFRSARLGIQFCTGDGMLMGYRAGAELISMEWGDGMYVVKDCDTAVIDGPVAEIGKGQDQVTNGYSEDFLRGVPQIPTCILWAIEFHKGKGPIYHEPYLVDREKFKEELKKYDETAEGPWITMLDRAGIDIFNDRFEQYMAFTGSFFTGGLRINKKAETNVPGLYAAGDASGTNFTGPTYAALGSGMCGASVTGYRAGENAAETAKTLEQQNFTAEEVAQFKERIFAPLERKTGFKTDHVLSRVQQTIFPYEIRVVMHEKRLQAAISMMEFYRDHYLPKIKADDWHDLRNAHEVRNMVYGGEIMLRAAQQRKESRGWFYREDYPRRDDENWLKWIIVYEENGAVKTRLEDVPPEFHGDLTLPYEKRYPLQYEGEG